MTAHNISRIADHPAFGKSAQGPSSSRIRRRHRATITPFTEIDRLLARCTIAFGPLPSGGATPPQTEVDSILRRTAGDKE